MITYFSPKTNKRYPEHDCQSSFSVKMGKLRFFIRGHGWRNAKKNEWNKEEIPDLKKDYTDDEWREYALKYGSECAQEFLDTCDYMKPTEAFRMFNPPKNKDIWENADNLIWFKDRFRRDMHDFIDGYMLGLGNSYGLDIIKFENHLAYEFSYPMHQDGSMHDFMIKTFGAENTDKFIKLFFPEKC